MNLIPDGKGELIAIVDDEACVRESLSSLLRSVGYRAEDFASAESFLESGKWDETACVILDVRLPQMSGLELQRHLAGLGPGCPPIIFISGHSTQRDRNWTDRQGAVAFLRKPFSDDALLNAVRESVAGGRRPEAPSMLFSFMGSPDVAADAPGSNIGTEA